MVELRIYTPGAGFREEQGAQDLSSILADEKSIVWVRVEDAGPEEVDSIRTALDMHPLALEHLDDQEDRPRFRRYDGVTSVLFFAVRCPEGAPERLDFVPLQIFMGARYLVTVNRVPMPELDEAYSRWKDNATELENNGEAPMYTVLDTLTDGYFPVTDAVADRVDEVEDDVLQGAGDDVRRSVFNLKRTLLRLRHVTAAGRDVVNVLLRHDDTTPDTDSIYLRDVYDHLTRITDAIDTYRDLLGNVMDAYLSVTSNRLAESANKLNVIMQILASWSIILGSATLITGYFGMNTKGLPLESQREASYEVMGMCLVTAVLLYLYFRHRKWV